MIITKKAIVGFILLAIITFTTAKYYNTQTLNTGIIPYRVGWHPPLIDTGTNAPIFITIAIELFTLGCYLGLKKLEPRINMIAEQAIHNLKEREEDQ
jgi:hypothetical protein